MSNAMRLEWCNTMTQINLLFGSRPIKAFSAIEGKSTLENWKENQIFQVSVVMTFSLQK